MGLQDAGLPTLWLKDNDRDFKIDEAVMYLRDKNMKKITLNEPSALVKMQRTYDSCLDKIVETKDIPYQIVEAIK